MINGPDIIYRMSGIFRRTLKIYFIETAISENLLCNLTNTTKMPFYAVARGRSTGIYHSWADCEAQVKGFSGAKFKKFDTESSANEFIHSNSYSGGGYASSSAYNNYQSSANKNLKRTYATSSKDNNNYGNKTSSWSNAADSDSTGDGLDHILNKQMDDIEKRVKHFSKGIDKITISASRGPQPQSGGKKTILIEPPQPKRYKRNDKTEFEEDNEGYVHVYTDGACSANGKQGAHAGLGVYWGDNHWLNRSEPVSGRATNNCGEIQAATLAIKTALKNGVKKLAINTDSQFLIKAATKWIPGWKRRGWKLASGEAVKNEIDFRELDSVRDKIEIKWNYVKAHNGKHGNEMADRLAKAGAARYNN